MFEMIAATDINQEIQVRESMCMCLESLNKKVLFFRSWQQVWTVSFIDCLTTLPDEQPLLPDELEQQEEPD